MYANDLRQPTGFNTTNIKNVLKTDFSECCELWRDSQDPRNSLYIFKLLVNTNSYNKKVTFNFYHLNVLDRLFKTTIIYILQIKPAFSEISCYSHISLI